MGRQKKGFNWKAREKVKGTLEDPKLETKIDYSQFPGSSSSSSCNGDSNPLILPSGKRTLKRAKGGPQTQKLLSKKKRKELERILDQKKKKIARGQLLEKLKEVQVDSSELESMTSLSSLQTKGLKRQFMEDQWREKFQLLNKPENEGGDSPQVIISHDNNKKFKNPFKKPKIIQNDPNVLGFEESSDESSDEDHLSEDEDSESKEEEETEETRDSTRNEENKEVKDVVDNDEKSNSVSKAQDEIKNMEDHLKSQAQQKTMESMSEFDKNRKFVPVIRDPEIQKQREKLPIIAEEQRIMEAIHDHPVVVLAGETGSGKTTQVPQFLYEAGYARDGKIIGITEPRRVAAMAMSKRVGHEMNMSDPEIAYQIRFEGNSDDEKTKIKFMTDGVLLREIEKDFLLTKYRVIILDEAHERSVFTDILIGFLSRIIIKREKNKDPLKLIIMSATLRIEDFTENKRLFKHSPPVIKVDSRQFEVSAHFNRITPDDYMASALKKIVKIHKTLPEGGILLFLTGQKEVNTMVHKLRTLFPMKNDEEEDENLEEDDEEETLENELKSALMRTKRTNKKAKYTNDKSKLSRTNDNKLPEINLDDYKLVPHADNDADAAFDYQDEEEEEDTLAGAIQKDLDHPLHVLPLYSLLNSDRQSKIFDPSPSGCRRCVVATNVAETSLTIPGIKYVVDCGKVKTKFYDKVTGVSTFHITYTSKASANQRAGRAGRTAPGHCYRLYSSAVFDSEFSDHAVPEIRKRPVEDLVLQMKSMHMDNVINFPFPTPPDPLQLQVAEKKLIALGALEGPPSNLTAKEREKLMFKSKITKLGKAISMFPLSPKFGKMLALSQQHDLLPYTLTMVAALSVQEVLMETPIGIPGEPKVELVKLRKAWAGKKGNSLKLGDPMVLMKAVGAAEYDGGCTVEFCNRYGLRYKAMLEIRKLRRQLANEINLILSGNNLSLDPNLSPPTDDQAKLLRQIILSGCPDQVGHKVDLEEFKTPEERKLWKNAYRVGNMTDPVWIHSGSVLQSEHPEWIVFQEIFEINGKMFMRGVTAIESDWLAIYANRQCTFGNPLLTPKPPRYDSVSDDILCYRDTVYGGRFEVGPTLNSFPLGTEKIKYFAQFLLEGIVFTPLSEWTSVLLSPPAVMTKSWANLQPRTDFLLKELSKLSIDSKSKLMKAFKSNPKYLLNAYLKWIPEALQEKVTKNWPPIDM